MAPKDMLIDGEQDATHAHKHLVTSSCQEKKNCSCFTCVNPLMGFQVGAFRVNFGTAGEIAVMNPPLLQFRIVTPIVLD